jgi:spermidine/putrescine transport system ATP-binding protein
VSADVVLALSGIQKDFGATRVVHDLDLTLRRGEFFSMLGPSGCGKTTTLRMIAGLERPSRGRVVVDGEDVTDLPANRRPVNTVFQSYALFTHLDVASNVEFGLREDRVPKRDRQERAREAMALARLDGFERRRPDELSGGQQQRVALARAIAKRPRLLLLDEPLGALDLKLRKAMQVELKQLQGRLGATFVYVTHDQEEALTMSDRIAVMNDGRVEQLGTPEEIYDRPATRFVAEFIGAANCVPGRIAHVSSDGFGFALGDGATVACSGPAPAAAGVDAWLVVRPECCRLVDVDAPHALAGRVVEVLFKGASRSYLVERADGVRVTVDAPHRPGAVRGFETGDAVGVTWSPHEASVVVD